jgi:hypothetical protein
MGGFIVAPKIAAATDTRSIEYNYASLDRAGGYKKGLEALVSSLRNRCLEAQSLELELPFS